MVDVDEGVSGAPARRRGRLGDRSVGAPVGRRRRRLGFTDVAPFVLLLAAVAPLAGALYRIVDLVGIDGLVATEAVGPRLQLIGNAVNPLTGLLLVAGVLAAVTARSSHLRMVAGTAVAMAGLLLTVAVAVTVAALRDGEIFSRANDSHVEVISYEISSALVALGVIWLALQVLRRPGDA